MITKECRGATTVNIGSHDSIFVSGSGLYPIEKANNEIKILFNKHSIRSFWYEFVIEKDCNLDLTVVPAKESDIFNFVLYQHPDTGNFCRDLVSSRMKIIPAKKVHPKADIILQQLNETAQKNAYRNYLEVKKGDVYSLIVLNVMQSNSGHYLRLGACDDVKIFTSVNQKDKEQPFAKMNPLKLVNTQFSEKRKVKRVTIVKPNTRKPITKKPQSIPAKPAPKAAYQNPNEIEITGYVKDSITGQALYAEVSWIDPKTGVKISASTDRFGWYTLKVKRQLIYELTFNSVGYSAKKDKLLRSKLSSFSMEHNTHLTSVKPGDNFVLNDIYFYPNTYAIREQSNRALMELYSFMKTSASAIIEIQGHTNGKAKIKKKRGYKGTNDAWNFAGNEKKLSKMRAEAVKEYLISKGIPTERIQTIGLGDEQMLYPTPKNKAERDQNKRVEVKMVAI